MTLIQEVLDVQAAAIRLLDRIDRLAAELGIQEPRRPGEPVNAPENRANRRRPSQFGESVMGGDLPISRLEHGITPNADGSAFALEPASDGAHVTDRQRAPWPVPGMVAEPMPDSEIPVVRAAPLPEILTLDDI